MLYTVIYWVRNPGATGVFWRTSRTILAGTSAHAHATVFNLLHAEGFETLHPAEIIPHDNPFLRPLPGGLTYA